MLGAKKPLSSHFGGPKEVTLESLGGGNDEGKGKGKGTKRKGKGKKTGKGKWKRERKGRKEREREKGKKGKEEKGNGRPQKSLSSHFCFFGGAWTGSKVFPACSMTSLARGLFQRSPDVHKILLTSSQYDASITWCDLYPLTQNYYLRKIILK